MIGDCTNCFRYGASHPTVHMAADVREGYTLILGPERVEARVVQIIMPFELEAAVVMKVRAKFADSFGIVVFERRGRAVMAHWDDSDADRVSGWGLKGHVKSSWSL